ncbi:hypothetical protein D3C74_301160 [compost metagenome]
MAGTAKPSDTLLEASYTLIGGSGSFDAGTQNGAGLFDGALVNEWNTNRVHYWASSVDYIEIDILSNSVNIWRSGTTDWNGYYYPLKIKKWNGASYDDVTSQFTQNCSNITQNKWEKTIENLPKGRYRFEYSNGVRLDSEWFIELIPNNKLLLHSNNKMYSITSHNLIHLGDSSVQNFIDYGLDSIDFNTINGELRIVNQSSTLGSGKIFEHTIDLRKRRVDKIILG